MPILCLNNIKMRLIVREMEVEYSRLRVRRGKW